jgi:hypothetical protein
MNILQSLISNSLLLAPCIVSTFEKTLTVVDIIKFTEEDEMKYLIVVHSSGKYFGINLRESNKHTSVISIVQDKDECMVMGWKVAKVNPTWVLGFVDWNNLMMSHELVPLRLTTKACQLRITRAPPWCFPPIIQSCLLPRLWPPINNPSTVKLPLSIQLTPTAQCCLPSGISSLLAPSLPPCYLLVPHCLLLYVLAIICLVMGM